MSDLLQFSVQLPDLSNIDDAVGGELTVLSDGGVLFTKAVALSDTHVLIEVAQGSTVELQLVSIDDAGNKSTPSVQVFDAIDTIPPEAPGPFGEITLVSESEAVVDFSEDSPGIEPAPEPEVDPVVEDSPEENVE